ncbi:DUF2147 domain-containing protein [Psychroflexus tropicus]|uniref:DUF2147 domain-containing protein n=1 Tax=Psychroflexus tropicus TaxID=197345 RepID=UPI00035DA8B1|nr:DUF2147 domain-containing protein [Psychroflexus tropicus]
MKLFILYFGLLCGSLVNAQDVVGEWKTIDDDSGVAKSIVEIYKEEGKLYGKVKKILREDKRDVRCTKCKGQRKNQKVEGMVILRNLTEEDGEYTGGTITDPENGKSYDAKIWIDEDQPNTLMVRGYVSFLYRTQEWKRVTD